MFRSAYLINVFDKLFDYQNYLSAILAERHTTQAMLVLVLPFSLLFGEIKYLPLSLSWFCRIVAIDGSNTAM